MKISILIGNWEANIGSIHINVRKILLSFESLFIRMERTKQDDESLQHLASKIKPNWWPFMTNKCQTPVLSYNYSDAF